VKYLDGLVREFLEFTREQRLKLSPVDLSVFLREVVELWRPLATDQGISIFLEAPENTPRINADQEKLRRVFDNLVKNALEAMGKGPGRRQPAHRSHRHRTGCSSGFGHLSPF
jgi:signal transduction histidine kinase